MTENANPKPFNISRQNFNVVSSRKQLYWVYQSISQSINRSVYRQIGWTVFKLKTIKNVKRSFIDRV